MNRKTLLIALREFHENLRTKTFWLGIAVFPIILLASMVIPSWLEDQKDVRKFAVLDTTDWLGKEVQARCNYPDLQVIYLGLAKRAREGTLDPTWPEQVKMTANRLKDLDDTLIRKIAEQTSDLGGLVGKMPGLEEANIEQMQSALIDFQKWWFELSAEDARDTLGEFKIAKQDFQLVKFPAGDNDKLREILEEKLRKDELFAYFEINGDPVSGEGEFLYHSKNVTDSSLQRWFERHANDAVQARRFRKNKISEKLIKEIQRPLSFSKKTIGKDGKTEDVDNQKTAHSFIPAAFVYLLWITTFMMAQMLLTNTIEEKSNRTIEVLLSSVAPFELMAGKIGGIAATGLAMIITWIIFFFLIVNFALPAMGIEAPIDISALLTDPTYLGSFVAYFILGYLLYAALIAGIGSVCNSLKEAQNLMMPVSVFLMLPLFAMIPVVQSPNGGLAKVLSYIPPMTPFIMMNRAAGPPTTMEYIITTIILLVSIVVTFYAAAKVFRIGILMTGKPPKVSEIIRWIKAPVGSIPDVENQDRDS